MHSQTTVFFQHQDSIESETATSRQQTWMDYATQLLSTQDKMPGTEEIFRRLEEKEKQKATIYQTKTTTTLIATGKKIRGAEMAIKTAIKTV